MAIIEAPGSSPLGDRNVDERLVDHRLQPGTRVEVRRRFDARWARGFEVAAVTPEGYRLRRLSDGEELPVDFDGDDLRPERHGATCWSA